MGGIHYYVILYLVLLIFWDIGYVSYNYSKIIIYSYYANWAYIFSQIRHMGYSKELGDRFMFQKWFSTDLKGDHVFFGMILDNCLT